MRPRAPDRVDLVVQGPTRLGQAFLQTGSSPQEAPNRLTLDGKVFLVADARLDARDALVALLRAKGRELRADAPHAELILHAYHALGDKFLDCLAGDFALALWDDTRQRLICARDPLGLRPFYFVRKGRQFLFASDIAALLSDPGVSRELDDIAIADFLLIGNCMEPERSIYRDVRCLLPGGRLDIDDQGLRQSRYWSPSWNGEIRFRKRSDYVEAFAEIFEAAVRDRLPTGPLGLSLSGGMDSTSIAAVAARHSRHPITGYHVSSSSLEPEDDEVRYAEAAATFLGVRLEVQHMGEYGLFARNRTPQLRTVLPSASPQLAMVADQFSAMDSRGERVHLDGFQGDALFAPSYTYYSGLIRSGRLGKFLLEAAHHVRHARSLRGMSLRAIWPRREQQAPWKPTPPEWIDPDFARNTRLAERWNHWWRAFESSADPASQLMRPWMPRMFEMAEILPIPVVSRYPFLDLRLIEFMTAVPNFVRTDKMLLREAMRGRLPESVRKRPKTGAPGDPFRKLVTTGRLTEWVKTDALASSVSVDVFERARIDFVAGRGEGSTWTSWQVILTIAWANWLTQLQESDT